MTPNFIRIILKVDMPKPTSKHPYHYSEQKNIIQTVLDFGFPIALFYLFFQFYNFGKITPSEMIKTTGLLSISLLGFTLAIGPLCKFFPFLNFLKANRKVWGISSFLIAFAHVSLVFIYFYKFDLSKFVDTSNPKYPGIISGLLALVILFLVTMTSNKIALTKLSPKTWKLIQTSSYLALILAVSHFFLMESTGGELVIKRLLGQITFWFSATVIAIRVLVIFFPSSS